MNEPDDQLLRRAAQGDDEAFALLYRRLAPFLKKMAYRILRDAHAADDIVQETFWAVLRAEQAGRGPRDTVRGYAVTVTRHLAYRQWRANQRTITVDNPISESEEVGITGTTEASAETAVEAAAAWESLPPRWRRVLWLIEVERYSPAELAPLMAMTPNAVSSLATRARRALRKAYLGTS